MASRDAIAEAMRLGLDEQADIINALVDHKVEVYRETLRAEARRMRRKYDPEVSPEIMQVLRREAADAAADIVDTYNREAADFIARFEATTLDDLLDGIEEWSMQRDEWKRQQIAITETYGPHADAVIAFYQAQGVQPDFDFGGHGDAAPACAICKALKAGNPHSMARVIEIGQPHIQCRQLWHPRGVKGSDLPKPLNPVVLPAGIIARDNLVQRAGGLHQAVAVVESNQ